MKSRDAFKPSIIARKPRSRGHKIRTRLPATNKKLDHFDDLFDRSTQSESGTSDHYTFYSTLITLVGHCCKTLGRHSCEALGRHLWETWTRATRCSDPGRLVRHPWEPPRGNKRSLKGTSVAEDAGLRPRLHSEEPRAILCSQTERASKFKTPSTHCHMAVPAFYPVLSQSADGGLIGSTKQLLCAAKSSSVMTPPPSMVIKLGSTLHSTKVEVCRTSLCANPAS